MNDILWFIFGVIGGLGLGYLLFPLMLLKYIEMLDENGGIIVIEGDDGEKLEVTLRRIDEKK